ncbi:MAG: hypothetical protein HY286_12085 [Planctomycetes bacterium]|nr:hypothetical protein [Planctomycetota bacterium]
MRRFLLLTSFLAAALPFAILCCANLGGGHRRGSLEIVQTEGWREEDREFVLHGSMSTECVPETVLHAFMQAYPSLFPTADLSHLGLIPDPAFGWPIGFSRSKPAHLGGLSSVGLNCASCHVGEIELPSGGAPVRVLGMTAGFDAEAFFNTLVGATFQSESADHMKKFLAAYLEQCDPPANATIRNTNIKIFESQWAIQSQRIAAAIEADPSGAAGAGPGGLQALAGESLQLNAQLLQNGADLARLSATMLKLFHNMRASLHVPDEIPSRLPPASGPGRNDAFGLLSAALFGKAQPFAPVKYGLVWNVGRRPWVHWDGNTRSPISRNMLASLGLGAPLVGRSARLDFALLQKQTELTEKIAPPKYPLSVDRAAALRGTVIYKNACADCHNSPEGDARLYSVPEVGTDPLRANTFTQTEADRINHLFLEIETPGYVPPLKPGLRSTQKYFAASLDGVWARAPYLHNGSVRTMWELLTPPPKRQSSFHRGSRVYDELDMGLADAGTYLLDIKTPGNGNGGHDYGTQLADSQKRDLIEYLKTQ